ncbi:PD-(D/E)XK nuclease family protein [Oribacterium asaccharolyticum]|uniref:PD-(D/E)XK nuclease family protein n=1 Tax=Oribacterium asaccharolyticum TaxID=1501332 RepID=UPI0028EF3A91|nr:PD-(D/E)XK nuclease family protein [Oribacterium asaccharolyticum]
MSTLQFVFGASGSGKTEFCIRKALEEAGKDLNHNVYYLVPEQDTLAMQKRIVMHENNKGKGIINLDVLSFQRLYYASFSHRNKPVPKALDEMGKVMVLSLVAEKYNRNLHYFQGEIDKPGFLEEAKSLISECMQYGISPENLSACARKSVKKLTGAKLHDMALLYEGFLNWLLEHKKYTEEGIQDLALEQVLQDSNYKNASFLLDGFTGFTVSELRCLEILMEGENDILISLEIRSREEGNLYDKGDLSSLFYLTKDAVKEVEELALKLNVKVLPEINVNLYDSISGERRKEGEVYPRFEKIPALQKICDDYAFGQTEGERAGTAGEKRDRSLEPFEKTEQKEKQNKPFGISIRECPNILREVEEAAAEIRALVKDEGYRYRDIAVIVPDPESYRDILFRKWKDLEIPFFLEEDIKLMDSPYGKVVRSALLVLEKGFLFDAVFRYLRAFPYRGAVEEELVDRWENLARERGLKGLESFSSLLQSDEGEEELSAGTEEEEEIQSKEKGESAYKKKVEDYQAYRDLTCLFTFFERNRKSADQKEEKEQDDERGQNEEKKEKGLVLKDRIDSLSELLEKTDLENRLLESLSFLSEEGMENREESFEKSIGIILEIMEKMRESLGEISISKKSFGKLFDLAFSLEKLRQIPATLDQVVVGDLRRSRFHNPKAFFFLGLSSEFLPKGMGKNIIFTEKERAFLRESGYRLSPLSWEESYIEKYYVYKAFLTPKERLYLSYPRAVRNGKSGKASPYLKELFPLFSDLKIIYSERQKLPIYNGKRALEELVEELPKKCTGKSLYLQKEEIVHRFKTESFRLLQYLWNREEYHEEVEKILKGIFFENTEERITKEMSLALYGEILKGSVSRMEIFYSCPYAHFLQYGLNLKDRKTSEVQAFTIGNLYHRMLELFFKKLMRRKDMEEAFGEKLEEILNEVLEELWQDPEFSLFLSGGRNEYLRMKLQKNGRRILWALGKQLLGGDFRPKAVEEEFKMEEEGLQLRGRIDRVDEYLSEDRKTLFLKVIDYKSGKKAFSLKNLFAGLDLQLPLYMDYVLQREKEKNPNREVLPSALFYFTMENPVIPYDKDSDPDKERLKAFKPSGLVNFSEESLSHLEKREEESLLLPVQCKNGEVEEKGAAVSSEKLEALLAFARKEMLEGAKRIKEGEKGISPIRKEGDITSCSYCPYHSICGFDEDIPNFRYRSPDSRTDEELWEEILKKTEEEIEESDTGEEKTLIRAKDAKNIETRKEDGDE